MRANGFNHATWRVSDLERSLRFYTAILGMKLVHRGRTDAYLEWGHAWICLLERSGAWRAEGADDSGVGCGLDHLAFSIAEADFPEAVHVLEQAGVSIVRGPLQRGGGWSVNFLDPDGIQLELFTGTLESRMKVWT
ncbi:VOC family protein [Paenibacillus konkukensis]|uniref:VOC family protein n=1 Tax=Paenibacillus konkukensis TaxID=2020716 RepID=UPI00201DCBA7|nr:VOC family protein [Paenibacillus konkukensis]